MRETDATYGAAVTIAPIVLIAFASSRSLALCLVLMFVMGIAWAIGKASVFKYVSDQYSHNIGVISGIVGLVGGLGGFLLPIMFGALVDLTGVNSTIFMLMWGITLVSLTWMYWTEIVPQRRATAAAPARPAAQTA